MKKGSKINRNGMAWKCAQSVCCRGEPNNECKRGPRYCDAVDYLDMVDAVFDALMDPTEDMNLDGFTTACRFDHGDTVPEREIAREAFKAMIRAAKEGK